VSDNDPRILSDEQADAALNAAVAVAELSTLKSRNEAALTIRLLLADRAARREREAADTALLKRLEWSGERCPRSSCGGGRCCPDCGECQGIGHAPDCAIRARIGGW